MNVRDISDAIKTALMSESAKQVHIYTNSKVKHKHKCSIDGCGREAVSKKLCNAHYLRLTHGKNLSDPIKNRFSGTLCAICDKPLNGKGGWRKCSRHYKAIRQKVVKGAVVKAFGDKCADCGISYELCVYDFHHLGDKKDSIAELLANGGPEEIASEAIKCVLLCSNCHRIRHGKENEYSRNN